MIAQNKLQPELQFDSICVAMLTAVLTEPDWITVPCYNKISGLILCQKKLDLPTDTMINNTYSNAIWCTKGHLFIGNNCIIFQHYQKFTNISNFYYYKKKKNIFAKIDTHPNVSNFVTECFSLIQNYFIQPLEFTLSVQSIQNFVTYAAVQSLTYKKLHWLDKIHDGAVSQHDGYLLSPVSISTVEVPRTVFHCTDGSYIDETLVCDGSKDCTEGTDEKHCICTKTSFSVCKYNFNSNSEKVKCSDFFYQCSSSLICIPYAFVCNGLKDCQHGEDKSCGDDITLIGSKT